MYTIYKSPNNKYFFTLKAKNRQIILTSVMYETKRICSKQIQETVLSSLSDKNYQKERSHNGKYFFRLKSRTNEVIGFSEIFFSETGCETGIISVIENGVRAITIDSTGESMDTIHELY